MRHHLFRPAVAAAGLAIAVAAGLAVGTADAQTAAHQVAHPPAATTTSAATPRTVFLITGNKLLVSPSTSPQCVMTVTDTSLARTAGLLQITKVGGTTYAFPATATPYLGHGLGLSLFNVGAVTAAETGGRLPVRIAYSGRVPSLPGVTITKASGGVATGYLTAAGAKTFGAVLARQFTAGLAGVSHGLLTSGVSLTLAGASSAGASGAVQRPDGKNVTLTVKGTDWAGHPANGGEVLLFNLDNSSLVQDFASFHNGAAKFTVPPGHYWVSGDFIRLFPKRQTDTEYVDVDPQFTVGGNTTVSLTAKAATSQLQMVTPKPAKVQIWTFQIARYGVAGLPVSASWIGNDASPNIPAPHLFVNPVAVSPSIGKLDTATFEQLGTATFAMGSKYLYNLAFQSSGTIPALRHVISQANLAALHVHFFSAIKSWGLSGTFGLFPFENTCGIGEATFGGWQFPAQENEYVNTSPALRWATQDILNAGADFSGGEVGEPVAYLAGQNVTDNLGAYPLHPAPNYLTGTLPQAPPLEASATRAGNTLQLAMSAFSDSVPGHVGQGTFPPVKTTGSYTVLDNGKQVAGGTLKQFYGPFTASAQLSRFSSQVQFTLNTSEAASLNPLSTKTSTTWSWITSPESKGTLPAGWTCLPGGKLSTACRVEPMLTLRYGVVGESLGGTTSPGPQVIKLSVGHIQLARNSEIISPSLSVSFNGGKTWHAATITGSNGNYAASFNAPADSLVSLRTTASDASGSQVTETITNAYQVAYQG